MTATTEAEAGTGVDEAVTELVKVLQRLDRPDLVERAVAAGARLRRPSTIVCVVGEFKQGKSSLVNGLLGMDVCPVDDDLATSAITLVRYADEPSAVVRRRQGEEKTAETIPIADLEAWASEIGNPRNGKGVERVEVAVPSAILRQGLVIVDTPGMGGLGAGHAAATLSFLPFADGVLLVSDASAELSAPEVEFLARATELCPTVMFVQTKIDLYPAWERIFDLNRGHLLQRGVEIPMVAVSSSLRTEALQRKDRELNERSRFPDLIASLGNEVVAPAKESAAARSAGDVRGIAAMVRSGLESEKEMLSDPAKVQQSIAELEGAKERLEHLRGPGAKWTLLLGDKVGDLSAAIMHRFRGGMRAISRDMDERIEILTKGTEWDDLTRDLQAQVADEVASVFAALEDGRRSIHAEIAQLLQDEHLSLPVARGRVDHVDASALWQGKSIDEEGGRAKRALKSGLTGVRGAQGGVIMLGMLGQFLPTAAGVLIASNPVLLGAGAMFGGMQVLEDRKRKVAMRRQSARSQVRQFLDDVQFEVGNELTNLIRELQRELRDEFSERLAELQRTYTATAQRAQEDAQRNQQEMGTRSAQVEQDLATLATLEKKLAEMTA